MAPGAKSSSISRLLTNFSRSGSALRQSYIAPMQRFEFCLPTTAKTVPVGPDWFHGIKYDGYRLRIERNGDAVRLITRGGYDWTSRYPWIAEAALRNALSNS
jgi:ATP-dependent DNA ligase